MEWIEVFVSTSQMGLEPVEAVLYECGLTGLMIHDTSDFAEFLENPHRDWDYVADELVEEKFQGSLPAFIAAFTRRQDLSHAELDEVQRMIDRIRRGE